MNFGNIDGVISEIVVKDVLLLTEAVETKDLSIVFEELLLG